jgi:hypothetical protein
MMIAPDCPSLFSGKMEPKQRDPFIRASVLPTLIGQSEGPTPRHRSEHINFHSPALDSNVVCQAESAISRYRKIIGRDGAA